MRLRVLADSWAKVDRADEHRAQLDEAIDSWLDTDPHEFWTDFNPDTGYHAVRLKTVPAVPLRIAAITSDAIHNLRGALDFMVYSLAVGESGQNPPPRHDKLAFPVAITPEEFKRKEATCRGALRDEVWAALRTLQPFVTHAHNPKESALWYLEQMDIVGKHRHLRMTTTVIGNQLVIGGTHPPGPQITLAGIHHPGPLELNAEFLGYTADVPGKVEMDFEATFDVAFGKGHGLPKGHRVREVLDTLRMNVENVLRLVEVRKRP